MDDIPSIADFRSPPVVEVVCGLQFEALPDLRSIHLGLFWERVRDRYPVARDTFPLPTVIENFGAPSFSPPLSLAQLITGGGALPRVQLVDSRGGQMIQIQNGRFHHNWEKVTRDEEYRRYKNIRPAFIERWGEFKQFVDDEGLGTVRPTQYEITYTNHIEAGELWDQTRGIADLLPWLAPPRGISGQPFELQFAMHTPVPKCTGRLHVTGKVGLRSKDSRPVLAIDLTVRGAPAIVGEDGDLIDWMDYARERIVRTFVELTSEKAHRHWGKK